MSDIQARARATVIIEFDLPSRFGGDWEVEKIMEDSERSAEEFVRRHFAKEPNVKVQTPKISVILYKKQP